MGKFYVGDRVVLTESYPYGNTSLFEGDEGTIVSIDEADDDTPVYYGVAWDKEIGGHDAGGGHQYEGHGWYVRLEDIKLCTAETEDDNNSIEGLVLSEWY